MYNSPAPNKSIIITKTRLPIFLVARKMKHPSFRRMISLHLTDLSNGSLCFALPMLPRGMMWQCLNATFIWNAYLSSVKTTQKIYRKGTAIQKRQQQVFAAERQPWL